MKVTTVVCAYEVPEELSLRLMKTKSSDIGYYKKQMRVTQYVLLLVLAGMSMVLNLIKFRKSKWRWIFLILLFIIMMLLICAVGNLPSNAVPQKGNVFEMEYHLETFEGTFESLLNGNIRTAPKLFYLYKIAITIYSVVILTGIVAINKKLTS